MWIIVVPNWQGLTCSAQPCMATDQGALAPLFLCPCTNKDIQSISLICSNATRTNTTRILVTGPAKIGHVGSQNLTTFQTFTHNFLLQHGMATHFSEIVHNLTGFPTHLTEPKYYISVLRYVSSNYVYGTFQPTCPVFAGPVTFMQCYYIDFISGALIPLLPRFIHCKASTVYLTDNESSLGEQSQGRQSLFSLQAIEVWTIAM